MKRIVKIMLSVYLLAGFFAVQEYSGNVRTAWTTRIENFVKHTVQTGDTLEKLARLYGTTVTKIASKNKLTQNGALTYGQKLVIPVDGYKEKWIL